MSGKSHIYHEHIWPHVFEKHRTRGWLCGQEKSLCNCTGSQELSWVCSSWDISKKKRNWVGEEQSNEKPLKIHQKWWQVDSVEKYRTAYDPKETFSSANNGGAAVMTWTLSRIVTLAFSERCSAESRNRRMHRRRQCVQNASQLTGQDFII